MTLPETQSLYFEDVSVGMRESYAKHVRASDVVGFAEISGDRNPIHLYTASLISAVIGTRLPGPGAIYISQTLRFLAPVRIGDEVVASVEIVELAAKGRRAKLRCECKVGDTLVLEGEAEVKIPARPAPQ